ncbi:MULTISPECIES: hypothetical protein [unclassified Microcystis]|uniref:hypothetical protein n=1 Tax=unclassified Microcystis TaxID=2643300 RepID=UPI00258AE574|nr:MULTISPECIES: hypothetical protein [unclassified Microcystis]MCA6534946.1 hypothetical protein [Pseudanabaena sp. M176S2SP2A07QC]MCA6548099.1 hypothetical protein [Pseudanabaena sp. M152S2SP2A07QC]MCA6555437.1 hypothetical protein [Pseudanabaena sp. M114S2SP2A07QC]MCA6563475.1 hypothetical protein [Pseudanabaena sp. M151S2SP2A07QC]MCA6571544.1 hypothetical protein [Pseudanabaena sp. M065S1SP2A07QC]MCA6580214.1 hypothetical protein [Pseudanabaena sp. M085S1SP2A07QC]
MITANPDVNIAQFVTAFNQLVDIHIVNILAIAERENYPITLTDFIMEDKDDVFDEEWDLAYAPSSNPDSDSNEAQLVSVAIQEQNQINYATQIQALALSMFDGLAKLGKDKTENKRDGNEQETSQPSTETNDERDLKLARDCRELLQVQGKEDGNNLIFERPDGKGIYKFSLEKASDTMTLKAKDRPVNPILVESQGKIIESNVTERDAANISRAVAMLNAQQTKPLENQK